ncbi:MAG: transcription antitermination factor NusB [Candidatus Cryptobacteroides sp.]
MLNRSILRIKAFETAYSSVLSGDLSLPAARSRLVESCEATRSLFVFLCGMAAPLTAVAAERIEVLRTKFNPTEQEKNPNMKFCQNRLAAILAEDPDLQKILKKQSLSWDQYDIFLKKVLDSVYSKQYYRDYMDSGESSLKEDCLLFARIYAEELEDNRELEAILEDLSLYWNDDLSYALSWCCRTFAAMGDGTPWSLPPLYASQLKTGKPGVDDDSSFARRLLEATLANYDSYSGMVYSNAKGWDPERLFLVDVVLVAVAIAEILNFPSIPVNVSMNEYVEISKYYGTPKSRVFVNGILDRIVKNLESEGSIKKNIGKI